MNQIAIFQPVGALALLTFIVLLQVPIRRFAAKAKKQVTASDFALGESPRVPEWVAVVNRNYMNLLESPILFYVICLMYFVTNRVSENTLALAWGYVGLRAAHSVIHIAYNNVMHRMLAFAASVIVLQVLWVLFFVAG